MKLELKRFQISRVGTHKSSDGSLHTFSEKKLQDCVDDFNQRQNEGELPPPLYIGHPAQTGKYEPLGVVKKLELQNGRLYATAYITEKLCDLVRSNFYKAVSAGFQRIGSSLKLDHVAFLNNPAIKGMEALNFNEDSSGFITFEQHIDFAETNQYRNESHKLDVLARNYMRIHPEASYYSAVLACIDQTNY